MPEKFVKDIFATLNSKETNSSQTGSSKKVSNTNDYDIAWDIPNYNNNKKIILPTTKSVLSMQNKEY